MAAPALLSAILLPVAAIPAGDPAASRFDALKTLVGTWKPAGIASKLRIRFSLTAGGTVLVEEWRRGDQSHSLTLYHRDGARLVATHYCPQGNQPRLALDPGDGPIRFSFRDATDLDAGESHLSSLSFDLGDPARPVRQERYIENGVGESTTLTLVREDQPPVPPSNEAGDRAVEPLQPRGVPQ